MYLGLGAITDGQAIREFNAAEDSTAQRILQQCDQQAKAAGVACDTLALVSSEPYEAIIEAAEKSGCDLIFMASHGRRGISGFLLGSETNKVLTHSKVPVLVYR